MKKPLLIALGAVAVAAVVLFLVLGAPWIYMFFYFNTSLPETPQTTYAEFPFKLVYKIDGKQKTLEDTFVCEFDRVVSNEGEGKRRIWKVYLKSGHDRAVFFKANIEGVQGDCGVGVTIDPEYYMGAYDTQATQDENLPTLKLYRYDANSDAWTEPYLDSESAKALLTLNKVELISWECAPPIENIFVKTSKIEKT